MDAAETRTQEGRSDDMDTSMDVLGERARITEESMDTGATKGGNIEKRPRGSALEIALAVDLEVVRKHAQW